MRLLSGRSIRTKLSILTCVVAISAATLTCIGLGGLGFHLLCTSEAHQLKNHARLLGHYSTPIVTLRNRAEGERFLASLAHDPSIEAACLFDIEQNCISSYGKAKSMTFPYHMKDKQYRLASFNRLEVLSQINTAGQHIGYVYLLTNTSAVQARLGQFVRGTGIVFLVVFGLSCVVAVPFMRMISRPILKLTNAVNDITHNDKPSISFSGHFSPECTAVLSAMNCLLAKIEESALVTERTTTKLQDRVAQGSHGLAQELKHLQQRQQDLERAKDAAEAANMAKSSFFADLSQEMSGPLDLIVDNVQSLQHGEQPSGGQTSESQLEAIRRNSQQLQRFVQDVAEIAKVEAGRIEITRVVCLPQSIIACAIAGHQSQAEKKGLTFEYQWRGSEEESMCCDPDRIQQVVQVLVDNAIRFTEAGGVRIVASFEHLQDSRQLRIEVTDTGVGIEGEDLNQIFEASTQSTCVSPDNRDTAMGLQNCHRIVSALGGRITVNSSLGEGSVFTVMLDADAVRPPTTLVGAHDSSVDSPVTVHSASVPTAAAACAESDDQPRPSTGRMLPLKILVVDDSDSNRNLTQTVLRRVGAKVECAENGLEAVQAAARGPFDLVLMDMQMPVMDGYSATREIHAQGIDVPIIALIASAGDFDEQRCRTAGCVGHLTKPVDVAGLLSVAKRVLPKGKALGRAAQPPAESPEPAEEPRTEPAAKPRSPYDIDLEPQQVDSF